MPRYHQSSSSEVLGVSIATSSVQVTEELRDEKIKVDDINVFYFESTLPAQLFETAQHYYEGNIRLHGGMGVTETIKDSSLKKPAFVFKGKVMGVFAIPAKYNPLEYITSYLSSAKKTSVDAVAQSTNIQCLMVMRETQTVCKSCGKEKALVSVTTGKPMPFGKECLAKAILSQRVNQ